MSSTTTETEEEFTRPCAWSGEDRAGKHYILTSTEGQEIVSEHAFRAAPADTAQQLEALTAMVSRLSRRLAVLEGTPPEGSAKPAARRGRPKAAAAGPSAPTVG